ncbi:lanthionine synthetase LanC family protein [Rhodohalobacter sulfatireducens]|uniref:Lanthionine synthetase C-like protein n=1 Tax=Rhodohalobacter sulfatireducens TaxID=2911366 RepID=A0ABS9KBI5_9BACT|nr:lanthionine synthetase LanC family protein [Rhodohalobacter sulfatireducens]MCG2588209.1 hypothetical protein [Rhodohalobacter sulfatireducens]
MNNNGLLNGKMGISIYFFHLAKNTSDGKHQEIAETLIDDVYQEVSKGRTPPNFEDGLAGIAWGIEYLVQQGFVEAETDDVLSVVDDKIYRHLVSADELPSGILEGIMGYILYILSRLEGKDIHDESTDSFIFKRLLIELVNRLGDNIENRKFSTEEPFSFDITWDLPICLILLGKIRVLNIYNAKIDRIIDHLTPLVLSLYPRLLSNRLYLLYSIEALLKEISLVDWRKHADLLQENLQVAHILQNELKNKNLLFLNGVTGISLIARRMYQVAREEKFVFNQEELIRKITVSEYWQDLKNGDVQRKSWGLLFGHAGIGLELLELTKKEFIS